MTCPGGFVVAHIPDGSLIGRGKFIPQQLPKLFVSIWRVQFPGQVSCDDRVRKPFTGVNLCGRLMRP